IAKEVHLDFSKYWIIGNRFNEEAKHFLNEKIAELKEKFGINIELAGYVPSDNEITKANLLSSPIIEIPDDNPAYKKTKEIAEKIFTF
ncbi:MAG: hypothetical protein KAR20_25225, partial [Candidatus Heimdallarchaeota archaeon]|nr:hypothetical protein [Candidatus Heimdallarchaeota archaeon]